MTEPVKITINLEDFLTMNSHITLTMYLRNLYVRTYNYLIDKQTKLLVYLIRRSTNRFLDTRGVYYRKSFKIKRTNNRREAYWQSLLRIEREALVCMALEREVCGYE